MRHIRMDIFHSVSKEQGKSTAQITLVLSLGLTLALGAKLFGSIDYARVYLFISTGTIHVC